MLNVNNDINKMCSVSDLSISTSIMQQLKSSSQSSQSSSSSLSLTSSLVSTSNQKSIKLESDHILSSSSNYNIIGGAAALAEAELDELDDDDGSICCTTLGNLNDHIELIDNEHNSKQIANSTKSLTGGASDLMSNKVNNIKINLMNSSSSLNSNTTNNTTCNNLVVLSPEEKVSNEAKEYWATIDLYNNSKLAFNKRLKSVKIKREKINAEINLRNQTKQDFNNLSNTNLKNNNHNANTTTEPCMCVKCTIVYHESVIKRVVQVSNESKTNLCNKCCKNSINCKCCNSNEQTSKVSLSSICSNATMSNNNFSEALSLTSTSSLNNSSECFDTKKIPFIKEELNQFEDKLFNIKNELVNLSETSLDVFQLLLQLSDTMLDINTQLNSNSSSNLLQTNLNSNNLFSLNNFLGSDTNNFLYEEEENGNDNYNQEILNEDIKNSITPQNHKFNVIEEFLHKTLNSSNSFRNSNGTKNVNNNSNSSISNIIKTYNNRNGSFTSTPSQSFRSTLTKQNIQPFNKPLQLKKLQSQYSDSTSSSPSSVANLIENIYEKTSVTQFVDSLLNHNKTKSINSIDETSNMPDYFSTLSSTNNEPVYQSIDSDYLKISKNTSSAATLTNLIGQPLNYAINLKKANSTRETFTTIKSSKSNCSSSSSSGCGGSSSICSSSNNDLTFMAENNNRNSTSSTTSSVLVSPTTSCLSTSSSNNEILNKKNGLENKNYENISTLSSSASSPHNSMVCSSSTYSNLPTNQYKRSNSVNYKTINTTAANTTTTTNNNNTTVCSTSMANRKPSFKFESNILNKVQFMNMNKTEKNLNESSSHLQDNLKSIKRQQSLSINKSFSHNQHQSGASLSNNQINKTALIKTSTKSSIIINQIKMNQISLDSGIFLPSETEEFNSFNLVR